MNNATDILGFDPELFNMTQAIEIEMEHIENTETDLDDYDLPDTERFDSVDATAEWEPSEDYADAVLNATEADWDAAESFCDC